MSNSISKLIVAGMTLALSLTSVNAQEAVKVSKTNGVGGTPSVQARAIQKKAAIKPLYRTSKTNQMSQIGNVSAPRILKGNRAPQFVSGSGADLYGSIIYSEAEDFQAGLYSIPTNGSTVVNTPLTLIPEANVTGGAYYYDGQYYVTQMENFWGIFLIVSHYIINLDTFDVEEVVNDEFSSVALDQEYDPTTGKVYGIYYNDELSDFIFGSQEVGTFVTEEIAPCGQYNALAISKEGVVYAIDTMGDLYILNKETGAATLVGSTGVIPQYLTSATIDKKTGVMYWTHSDDFSGSLYTVDTATAAATLVADFEDAPEIVGLYIPAAVAEDGAPAAIAEVNIGNPDGSEGAITTRVAEISFLLPTKTFAEGSLSSPALDYTILRNGKQIASGKQNMGTIVKYLDVVPKSGEYTYTVYASNEEGMGPKTQNIVFIGTDTPVAPKNVEATYANGEFTVTWDAVDAGQFGGALSSDITYTVYGYSNDAQFFVKNNIAGTSYTVAVEDPATISSYFFAVEANTSTTSSEVATSASIALGSARTPFEVNFDSPSDLALFTVIDANDDARTWEVSGGTASVGYNSSLDMDDWLITPPIALKGGYLYEFYFAAYAGSDYYVPERIEAAMGTAATVEAMTTVLVEPTDLYTMENKEFRVSVKPEADGEYYFGLHGISPADMLRLHVDYIGITAGLTPSAPAAATNLKLTPATDGSLNATISYDAPATTIGGAPTSLMAVELYRDGELININKDVKAGEEVVYEDVVPEAGQYTYSVIAYNVFNGGEKVSVTGFVGINIPAAPAAATVAPTANEGEVLISWDAVTTDQDGNPMNPDFITYAVLDGNAEVIDMGLTETSITYQAVPAGDQDFVNYYVFAVSEAGVSEKYAATDMIAVGTPFELPYAESFTDGGLSYPMAIMGGNGEWQICDNSSFSDIADVDGTNGYAVYGCQNINDQSALFTGLIKLDAETPGLSFAYYAIADNDDNTIDVMVKTADSDELVLVETVPQNGEGWIYKTINLSEYAGKTVQLYFVVTVKSYVYTFIDDIRIQQLANYDLVAQSVSAPALVQAGEEFNVNVSLMNMGTKTAETYSVELTRNGEIVASVAGEAIESFKTGVVSIPQTLGVVDPESNVYSAKVVYDLDEIAENNVTGEYAVALEQFNAPMAENVKAVSSTTGVELTWNAPDMSKAPLKATTDDFESYAPFATGGVGEWTLVDVDGGAIGGVQGVQFGDIVPGEAEAAYFVMNTELAGVAESASYDANSGVQYMVSTFLYSGNAYVDDWMITPELSGTKQTISFYAKSFNTSYPESFKVLYSTTDPVTEEFVELATVSNVPGEWTKYSYTVPEGAKYFAINCVSYDAFMFFVDDVTYAAAGSEPIDLTLVGYNIYKNGVKLNEAPVTETSYVDAEGSADDLYQISVVYEQGETAATAAVKAETALIGKVEAGKANVKVEARSIVVTGAEGNVNVYTADGKMVYNAAGEGRNVINVAPGVYVVKTGKLVEKVIVK